MSSMSTPPSSSGGAEPGRVPDVLVVGRLLADLYPNQLRRRSPRSRASRASSGASPATSQPGLPASVSGRAILTRVGDDGHGEFCRAFLEREGVDTSWLGVDADVPHGLAFCEAWPPDHFPITYYRTPSCPDWEIAFDDFSMDDARAIPWCLLTGTGTRALAEPGRPLRARRGASRRPDRARPRLAPMLWDGTRAYRAYVRALAPVRRRRHRQRERVRARSGGDPLEAARWRARPRPAHRRF